VEQDNVNVLNEFSNLAEMAAMGAAIDMGAPFVGKTFRPLTDKIKDSSSKLKRPFNRFMPGYADKEAKSSAGGLAMDGRRAAVDQILHIGLHDHIERLRNNELDSGLYSLDDFKNDLSVSNEAMDSVLDSVSRHQEEGKIFYDDAKDVINSLTDRPISDAFDKKRAEIFDLIDSGNEGVTPSKAADIKARVFTKLLELSDEAARGGRPELDKAISDVFDRIDVDRIKRSAENAKDFNRAISDAADSGISPQDMSALKSGMSEAISPDNDSAIIKEVKDNFNDEVDRIKDVKLDHEQAFDELENDVNNNRVSGIEKDVLPSIKNTFNDTAKMMNDTIDAAIQCIIEEL